MKTNILLTGIIALCLLTSCGEKESQEPEAKERLFGVSFQTMNNPFFVDLNEGLKDIIDARGDRLITLDAQWDSLRQKNDISDLILRGASVIFINPVNWEGVKGSLLQAKQKGIPCIVVDAPVKDKDLILSTVASDNIEAGRMAARALIEARKPAKVGILEQSINKACIDRVVGFREVIEQYPEMEIVDVQEVKGTTESSRPVMRDMIGRHPEINVLFAINDPTALGAISALESAGKLQDVLIAAVDGSAEAITAIKNGKMLSTSAQFPREIGQAAAQAAYDHLEGKSVEKDVKVRVELITAKNADSLLAH